MSEPAAEPAAPVAPAEAPAPAPATETPATGGAGVEPTTAEEDDGYKVRKTLTNAPRGDP